MDLETTLSLGYNERGNTSLINPETGGTAFFAEIEEGLWLVSICRPENYPAWAVYMEAKSLAEMRTMVEEEFADTWFFQKNNMKANALNNSPVEQDYVVDAVERHIYSADNKDYATNDTVTVIQDFLGSKDWSLDIDTIESIRKEFDEDK